MSAKRTVACKCGSTMSITWSPYEDRSVDKAFDWFWREHSGDGHGPATLAEAGRAWRKAYRLESQP